MALGMKAHIGVDAESGLAHTVLATAANVADVTQSHALLHGRETVAFGDAGYQGVEKREGNQNSDTDWHVAMKQGLRKALPDNERQVAGIVRAGQGQHARQDRASLGAAFEVARGGRKSSPSFGHKDDAEPSAVNRKNMWIPNALVHVFLALEDETHLHCKTDDCYAKDCEAAICWSDPRISIEQPTQNRLIISNKYQEALISTTARLFSYEDITA